MADQHITQTRPKFTWLFPSTSENPKPRAIMLRASADTEEDARQKQAEAHHG